MSGAILILHGDGASVAMWRSWDLLRTHWPTALFVGLIMTSASAVRLAVSLYLPAGAAEQEFAALLGLNLLTAAGVIGGYVAAVALLLTIEPPSTVLREIFG